MRAVGRAFAGWYRLSQRVKFRVFSAIISGAFARFGEKSTLQYPVRLHGEDRIEIGRGVFVGANSWLQTLPDGDNTSSALYIGNGTSAAGACIISAVRSVVLEEGVLLARNVYISDHSHRYTDVGQPVLAQGVDKIEPVLIRRGAWVGQNVVVCPGVTIGAGAVIGANSVVNRDVPDWSVAAGVPARVIKRIDFMRS